MTDPILRLEPTRLSVEPGGEASLTLTVTNPGTIVEGYSLDVVSTIPMPWVQVNPETLSVYPQQDATAVIVFSPPSGSDAPSGTFPFGVRVWSEVEGGGSAVAEGDLDVGSVAGLHVKLTPIASSGRWRGRHTLTISNWGNAPARLRITPEDPDQALGFLVSPEVVDVPLGGEVVSRFMVRTRHPTLRGAAQRLPFQVACEPEPPVEVAEPGPIAPDPGRPVVDGAFNQKPILTRMVVAAAAFVLLAGIGAAAYAGTRHGNESAGDVESNPFTPTGFEALDNVSPKVVTLTWDAMKRVDGYRLYYYHRDTGKFESPDDVGKGSTVNAVLPPETYMCFQLTAYRGKFESEPTSVSDEACGETEPAGTKEIPAPGVPSPSVSVTPDVAAGAGGTPSVGTPSGQTPSSQTPSSQTPSSQTPSSQTPSSQTPSSQTPSSQTPSNGKPSDGTGGGIGGGIGGGTGGGTGPTPSPVDPDAPPLSFISYVAAGSPDDTGEAHVRTLQQQYAAAGVRAKVLRTRNFGLNKVDPSASPPVTGGATPPADLWVVYLDGETATQAANACQKAHLTLAGAGGTPAPDQCAAATYQVVSRPAPVLPSAVVTP